MSHHLPSFLPFPPLPFPFHPNDLLNANTRLAALSAHAASTLSSSRILDLRKYLFNLSLRPHPLGEPSANTERISYELLKWEEFQQRKRGQQIKRELEWASIAREIALMNKPYSRQ